MSGSRSGSKGRSAVRVLYSLSLLLAAAQAQTPGIGAIRGQVLDSGRRARRRRGGHGHQRGDRLLAHHAHRRPGALRPPRAAADGHLPHPAPTHEGLAPQEQAGIQLRAGQTAAIDVVLNPAAVEAAITVYGAAEGVQSGSPQLGDRFDTERIQETPIIGRKLTSLPLLDSAVRSARGTGDLFLNNTLFVINGGGRRQPSFTIDGSTRRRRLGPADDLHQRAARRGPGIHRPHQRLLGRVRPQRRRRHQPGDPHGDQRPARRRRGPLPARRPAVGRAGHQAEVARRAEAGERLPLRPDRARPRLLVGGGGVQRSGPRLDHHLAAGARRLHRQLQADGSSSPAPTPTSTTQNHLFGRFNLDHFTDTNPQDVVGGNTLPSAGRDFRRDTQSAQIGETAVLSDAPSTTCGWSGRTAIRSPSSIPTPLHPVRAPRRLDRRGVALRASSPTGRSSSPTRSPCRWRPPAQVRRRLRPLALRRQRPGVRLAVRPRPVHLQAGDLAVDPHLAAHDQRRAALHPGVRQRPLLGRREPLVALRAGRLPPAQQPDAQPGPALRPAGPDRRHQQRRAAARLRLESGERPAHHGPRRLWHLLLARSSPTSTPAGSWPARPASSTSASRRASSASRPRSRRCRPSRRARCCRRATSPSGRAARATTTSSSTSRSCPAIPAASSIRAPPRRPSAPSGSSGPWFLSVDGVHANTTDIAAQPRPQRPVGIRPQRAGTGPSRRPPPTPPGRSLPVANGYRRILVTVNNGESKYDGLQLNLRKDFEPAAACC